MQKCTANIYQVTQYLKTKRQQQKINKSQKRSYQNEFKTEKQQLNTKKLFKQYTNELEETFQAMAS